MVILRTLLENNLSRNRALVAEHGLSFLVETGNKKILFDCSAGKAARKNAEKMHVSLKDVDYVILSHSHYDHAGGYPDMASHGVHAPLVTGPRFFEEKYARDGEKYTYLGCGFGQELLEKKGIRHLVCEGTLTLFPGCHVAGGFERRYGFEKPPARFVRQTAEGMVEDVFPDEVCLVIEDGKGHCGVQPSGHLKYDRECEGTFRETCVRGFRRFPSGGGGRGETCGNDENTRRYGDYDSGFQPLYRGCGAGASGTVRGRYEISASEDRRLYFSAIDGMPGTGSPLHPAMGTRETGAVFARVLPQTGASVSSGRIAVIR